ncbi:MAG: NAD(P)H-hydrate epimerase, partial [candidate division WOR-3 bacterium]
MRVVTNAEMKKIDAWSMKTLGIPGGVLMENAGRGCVNVLEEYFDVDGLKVLIICGKGNNGGDGFVIGRHLQNRGSLVKIILAGKATELKGDARLNYNLAEKAEIDMYETVALSTIKKIYDAFHPAVVIDALFGTGFEGAPTGIYYKLIEMINNADAFVFSVDIPSGINGDNGQFEDTCVIADATAT